MNNTQPGRHDVMLAVNVGTILTFVQTCRITSTLHVRHLTLTSGDCFGVAGEVRDAFPATFLVTKMGYLVATNAGIF